MKQVRNNNFLSESFKNKSNDSHLNSDLDALTQLVELLRSVDLKDPDAKLNATTISDGRGGRIVL